MATRRGAVTTAELKVTANAFMLWNFCITRNWDADQIPRANTSLKAWRILFGC